MLSTIVRSGKFWIIASVIIIISGIIFLSKEVDRSVLLIDHVTVEKLEDIIHIEDSLITPVLYANVNILDDLDSESRKEKFIDILLPTILIYRNQLAQRRRAATQRCASESTAQHLGRRSQRRHQWRRPSHWRRLPCMATRRNSDPLGSRRT